MRADRLISIIMFLQAHARMTAEDLATELEVSPRTIYRDITALNIAGVPIYTDRGPGGGVSLIESYRTTLTGMTENEIRALFMLNIPRSLVDLGVGQELKSALLKFAGSLPLNQRDVHSHTLQRIYLDSTSWNEPVEPTPHLGLIHRAVWQDHLVRLVYQGSFGAQIDTIVEPLGLVAKLDTWYLVGRVEDYVRVFKTTNIIEVEILEQVFSREDNFDLPAFWSEWCLDAQNRHWVYPVELRISPELLSKLHFYLKDEEKYTLKEAIPPDSEGWRVVTIQYDSFPRARGCILNFGRAAEVLNPEPLKLSVIDFARQIIDFYQERPEGLRSP